MKIQFILGLVFSAAVYAETTVSSIITDHMVLQQKQENPIWGWDEPGTEIKVSIAGRDYETTANKEGNWRVKLAPMAASSEPKTLKITGTSGLSIEDVLVGEVWLCSGQSNMEWSVGDAYGAELAIAGADQPEIRLITVPKNGSQELQKHFDGKWVKCSPQTVGRFSAVGYYYGKSIHDLLGVPVGLIDNAWGGSAAEAWVKRDLLEADGGFSDYLGVWEKNEKKASALEAPLSEHDRKLKAQMSGQHRPGNLYAGCLHPIIGYGIKGVIWYQGETNNQRAAKYNDLMTLLIGSWREDWQQGDFPFYFVQLADYMDETDQPVEEGWAALREAQTKTLQSVSNTGQAVIIDLGQANDIHPRKKREVAERLVRWALVKDYGFEMNYRSPEFNSMKVQGNKAVLTFDHVGKGLKTDDSDELRGFAVCGKDREWKTAIAKFDGNNRIEVSAEGIEEPVAVRYAWANNPRCNILSYEGLPLTPFRTDSF
ncbi:sialate O-acetylesterase [Luteolibacter algae]|uniref:Sialate O-acetylesterase n=1 Tax=Luteolibacter algae TaxID=454151 RepID=A0ABW5D8W1_9BACT